jgi:hypothetical protein
MLKKPETFVILHLKKGRSKYVRFWETSTRANADILGA